MNIQININCDIGESFGLYQMGDDEAIMPLIDEANIACGYHASDPNHMRKAVELAKENNVKVGAHFSLPDLVGFGRREMKIDRAEMVNIILYQVGALKGFLEYMDLPLNHLKPHGVLYGMAARQEHIAHAIADVGEHFNVPIFGMPGTLHEKIYNERGLNFKAEFFADLDYDDEGNLLITRKHELFSPHLAAEKVTQVVAEQTVKSINGKAVPMRVETICVHSDTPNAVDIITAVRQALANIKITK